MGKAVHNKQSVHGTRLEALGDGGGGQDALLLLAGLGQQPPLLRQRFRRPTERRKTGLAGEHSGRMAEERGRRSGGLRRRRRHSRSARWRRWWRWWLLLWLLLLLLLLLLVWRVGLHRQTWRNQINRNRSLISFIFFKLRFLIDFITFIDVRLPLSVTLLINVGGIKLEVVKIEGFYLNLLVFQAFLFLGFMQNWTKTFTFRSGSGRGVEASELVVRVIAGGCAFAKFASVRLLDRLSFVNNSSHRVIKH